MSAPFLQPIVLRLRGGVELPDALATALEFIERDGTYQAYDLAAVKQDDVLTYDGIRWIWRSVDDEGVPPYSPREGKWGKLGEQVYQDEMAGTAIVPTLDRAAAFLRMWIAESFT